jgi:hypothetical protein
MIIYDIVGTGLNQVQGIEFASVVIACGTILGLIGYIIQKRKREKTKKLSKKQKRLLEEKKKDERR